MKRCARACALLATAAALPAQWVESIGITLGGGVGGGHDITATMYGFPGSALPGGYGYSWVALENRTAEPREARLRVETRGWRAAPYSCERTVPLAAGERARTLIPLPSGDRYGADVTLELAGVRGGAYANVDLDVGRVGLVVLCVSEDPVRFAPACQAPMDRWAHSVLHTLSRYRRAKTAIAAMPAVTPEMMPDSWQWLSGFDLVVLDGGARIDGAQQRVLVEHVAGGGRLLVLHPAALPPGAVRELVGAAAAEGLTTGQHGFGTWYAAEAIDDDGPADLRQAMQSEFSTAGKRDWVGPVAPSVASRLHIPGLGEVPTRAFFFVILLFAILVGPLNHMFARRRKQPMLMLVTVPAIGVVATGLLVLFGLFSEGLGTKGVGRSITLLDQRTHTAVAVANRTLYAGLAPTWLTLRAGTFVDSLELLGDRRNRAGGHALDFDLDAGRVSGTLLPSRTPTSLTTVDQGTCRARLRFQRQSDGSIVPASAPDLVPVDRAGAVLLIDFDGRFYLSEADGVMTTVDAGAVRSHLNDLLQWARLAGTESGDPRGDRLEELADLFADAVTPQPGTYLAIVERSPAVVDFDLAVDELASLHLVRGVLSEEDFVE